jgi:DNA-binding NarL/FixJ family response regulator
MGAVNHPALHPASRHLPPARLLVVEDHPLYREGLMGLLQRNAPQLQCRAADSADDALRLLHAHDDIDLVLCDLCLPGGMDGLQLLVQVGREFPTAARVLVSGSDDAHLPAQARGAGLMGYLPKALSPSAWMDALGAILAGDGWFPPSAGGEPAPTPRQQAVLQFLAEGLGNKEIARRLDITPRTVKYHLTSIYGALMASNRAEAVARAAKRGWIRLP